MWINKLVYIFKKTFGRALALSLNTAEALLVYYEFLSSWLHPKSMCNNYSKNICVTVI